MGTTQPIRNTSDINLLKRYFLDRNEVRNYTLITLGVNTALRISDLLQLCWKEVYDFGKDQYHSHITIVEKKHIRQLKYYLMIK